MTGRLGLGTWSGFKLEGFEWSRDVAESSWLVCVMKGVDLEGGRCTRCLLGDVVWMGVWGLVGRWVGTDWWSGVPLAMDGPGWEVGESNAGGKLMGQVRFGFKTGKGSETDLFCMRSCSSDRNYSSTFFFHLCVGSTLSSFHWVLLLVLVFPFVWILSCRQIVALSVGVIVVGRFSSS